MSDTFSIRNKIAIGICDTYFGGSRSLKGKIIIDLSKLKADYLLKLQEVLEDQQSYILNEVTKKQEAGGFKTPLGKFRYLYSIAGRLVREAEYKPAKSEEKSEDTIDWEQIMKELQS